MPIDTSILTRISFFEGLPQEELAQLAAACQLKVVPNRTTIAQVGESLNFVFIIISGELLVHEISDDGRIVGIRSLKSNDSFGWLQLVDGLPITCSLHASGITQLLLIPIQLVQRLALPKASFVERLLKYFAHSIRLSQQEKAMLSLPNALHRIIVHLNQLSQNRIVADQSNPYLSNLPKQHELASIVNTSRETISRTLQLLIKNGILKKEGHHIFIERDDLLNKLAAEGPDSLKSLSM